MLCIIYEIVTTVCLNHHHLIDSRLLVLAHIQYVHSGYDFPFNPFMLIPFADQGAHHNFHHSHNVDNFGALWHFWDDWCGTNQVRHLPLCCKAKDDCSKRVLVKSVLSSNLLGYFSN